jgi:zinc finger BED domain-containing protein 1 (E3 SUMO-protein ligase ZBED1)
VWDDFGIPPHRIVAVAHDNGSNIVNAMELLRFKYAWIQSIRCAGHTIQLCLSEVNKDQQITSAINSVHKTVKFFKHSELATTALTKKQEQMGIPEKSVIHDIPTRWNSTQQMIERILEQCWAAMAVHQELKKKQLSSVLVNGTFCKS